jgi:hypothetical protein
MVMFIAENVIVEVFGMAAPVGVLRLKEVSVSVNLENNHFVGGGRLAPVLPSSSEHVIF